MEHLISLEIEIYDMDFEVFSSKGICILSVAIKGVLSIGVAVSHWVYT